MPDGGPVRPAGDAAHGVGGLHRRLELIAVGLAHAARREEQRFGLGDQVGVPQRRVLLGERHVVAGGGAPRAAPRLGMKHQREQPERLGLVGHQRHHEPPEPDRLFAEIAAARFGAGGIGPAFGERRVDRFQHGGEALAQIGAFRHAERDAGLPDLRFRPRKALAHGGRRHQEGRADGRGIEAEDRLQDERRADAGIDRRMGAGEHQGQAMVRHRRWLGVGKLLGELLGEELEMGDRGLAAVPPPRRIDGAAPRHGEQPAFGIVGDAASIPVGQRRGEGVGERILGAGDVAAARGEEGHQLAVAAARHRLRGGARGLSRHRDAYMVQTGRTSIAPKLAPGQRAAQDSAASRSGTSIR